MNGLDYAVLISYFVIITLYGLYLMRKVRSSKSYFLGDRKFSWWVMMGQAFGTGTHAEMPVAQAGATFSHGFSTLWYQWKNMLITPFYWLMAPIYRRSERTTVGEIVEDRYGRDLGLVYSVFAIAFFVFNMGAMLQGAAKVIAVIAGDVISPDTVVIAMTIAFLLYSFFGGMIASAYTNFIQAFLIIILSMLLIPFGLREVGGFSGMRGSLPSDFFKIFSEQSGMGAFTIAMLAVNGIVGITAQPHMVAMFATGNNERSGRIGQTFGSLVKRLCTIGWALSGLIVAALVIKNGVSLGDPELAFGYGCRELLLPGLIGLMVAAILAANMSTCSNFMVNTGALFSENFYKKYVNPRADDRMMLRIGRYSGLLLSLLGVVFALTIRNVLNAFLFTETIAAFMGIIVLGGVLWKRANRFGALAALVISFSVYYALNFFLAGTLMLVYKWQPGPFGWAMLAGFAAFILVSLVTKPENPSAMDLFFGKMSRSSDPADSVADGSKKTARETGKDMLLLDIPGWFSADRWKDFFTRYREDTGGFLLSWVFVGLLILFAWAIMQIR
jgi:Na+/proline symporter